MRSRFRQEKRREGGQSFPDKDSSPQRPAFSRIRLSEVLVFPFLVAFGFGCDLI
jgi:hypothetical protein